MSIPEMHSVENYRSDSENKIVAISVFEGRISSRFDCCTHLELIGINPDNSIAWQENIMFTDMSPVEKIQYLVKLNVSTLICGGLPQYTADLLRANNINVTPWIQGEVKTVIGKYLAGMLIDD